jgi:hypothetical protein
VAATSGDRSNDVIGGSSVVGFAIAPFAILFSVWIPTLALILGLVTLGLGAMDLRGATGRRRTFARLTLALGLASIALVLIVVVATTV